MIVFHVEIVFVIRFCFSFSVHLNLSLLFYLSCSIEIIFDKRTRVTFSSLFMKVESGEFSKM